MISRSKRLLILLSSALCLFSCAKQELPEREQPSIDSSAATIEFHINASCVETRTAVDGKSIVWSAGDKLAVAYSHNKSQQTAVFEYESGSSFAGEVMTPDDPCDWYAIYPSSAAGKSGCSITIPAESVQHGNSNMDHLAGEGFPLWGRATGIAGGDIPHLQMEQVATVIDFNVSNQEASPIKVSKVIFTAPVEIAGQFTGAMTSGSAWTPATGKGTKTVVLNVEDGEAIAPGASAAFYMGTIPFSATGDYAITVYAECGGEEIYSTKNVEGKTMTFDAGVVGKINYKFVNSKPQKPVYEWETTYAVFASDRHSNTSAISTAFRNMPSAVPYVCLVGDMVGSGGGDHQAYNSSTVKAEVDAVFSNATTQIFWADHDASVTDNAGIVKGATAGSSGLAYTAYDSHGNVQYYVYNIAFYDMNSASNGQTAAAAFESWVSTITDHTVPIFVACHIPLHAARKDNYGAYYWNRAITYAATGSETGTAAAITRNVIFFHGHNHTTESNKEYYYAPGSSVKIAKNGGDVTCAIPYTYVTGGYLNANKKATLVQVNGTDIVLTKYGSGSATQLGTITRVTE